MAPKTAGGMFEEAKFNFTEARLEQARKAVLDGLVDTDASGRRSWLDDDCPGLRLTVNGGTGSSVFYFQGKVNGQTVRKALGDTDAVRLVQAREAVRRLRYDRTLTGALAPRPSDEDESADRTPVVKGVLDAYLDAHEAGRWLPGNRSRKPTDRTMKFYRDLRRAVMTEKVRRKRKGTDEYEMVDGEDFEQLTLQAFADRLPAIHAAIVKRAPVQGNRAIQLWRNLFAYAADTGAWKGANPAIGTGRADRLPKTPEIARTRTLTDGEWQRLDKALKAEDRLWRDLFTMSLSSLMRMEACYSAQWSDVTLTGKGACWRVPARWMKGRRGGNVVPLDEVPQLLELLRERRKIVPMGCPWIFPAPGGDGPARWYKSPWKRVLERARLWTEDREQRPRPHDLRRTGGLRMTDAGVPIQTVTRCLGNAPSSATMVAKVYAQVSSAAVKGAYAAVSRRGRRR